MSNPYRIKTITNADVDWFANSISPVNHEGLYQIRGEGWALYYKYDHAHKEHFWNMYITN